MSENVHLQAISNAIRGRASNSPIRHRIRLWQRYMFTVIVNSLRKAESTALAIDSRGFGAHPTRTYTKSFRWTTTGVRLILFFIAFAAWLILWERNLLPF